MEVIYRLTCSTVPLVGYVMKVEVRPKHQTINIKTSKQPRVLLASIPISNGKKVKILRKAKKPEG